MQQPRYSKEEHARRGTDSYNNRIKQLVADQANGQIVAIDVDSGEYEVADNTHAAATRLLSRLPDAQVWCVRIGHEAVRNYCIEGVVMSQSLELPDPLYDALQQAAAVSGTTPQGWIAAQLGVANLKQPPANAKTLADLLAGRIGRISSSGEGRRSENCGASFADHLDK